MYVARHPQILIVSMVTLVDVSVNLTMAYSGKL